jgi:ribosomal protein S6--L-glutamate ligase/gamma-F420-2:alpha-L-glutamate ligase
VDQTLKIQYENKDITLPDRVFMRCYDLNLLRHLEHMGIKTFNNSNALEISRDKWKTHHYLSLKNLKSPRTILVRENISFEFLGHSLGLPFILKDSFGTHGEEVFLIYNLEDFNDKIKVLNQAIGQVFIKSSYGKDIRVHVINGEVVASVLRSSEKSFLSNYSQGGTPAPFLLDDQGKKLAIDATRALGLDFSGIDLLFDQDGYTICEVNGIPGFRTLGLTTKENLPSLMLTYIKESL